MLTIGSRGSPLALAQTGWVRDRILERFPDAGITIKVIRTSADKAPQVSIRSASSVGVFVKELEEALQRGEIDLAVHSMKDLPGTVPETLEICSIPPREDARDALIAGSGIRALTDLPRAATVGTGSIRRQAQLLAVRPDLMVRDIRGNVDTRLQKLADHQYDAVILACAGLNRLGLQARITRPLEFDEMLPAPGQGALALQSRRGDRDVSVLVAPLHHGPTAAAVLAERAFLRQIGGGCNSPVAVHAAADGDYIRIEGLVAAPDGSRVLRDSISHLPQYAEDAAALLADRLLARGGRTILDSVR
jgi:hydroxymethylbilane synthase